MQTLRKKTSPFKYKHETSKFHGEGQCFKAKLIGILEVSEARGDRMCQEALSDLKMAIRAAGEHKQRITVHIALDGLRLRDEKTGDCLYHHPVHKISFIAQDMTDSRAFGYIFGSPDTGHRFFGIKTDKAASQVVIAMRDLFQVVFALKKKEIELAKQHLEKNCLYNSSLFSDSSSNKSVTPELPAKYEAIKNENKSTSSEKSGTTVANLVDLQLELNSLQQGLNQMEKITPSEPIFNLKDDPFGDSFTSFPVNPILPPPPSSGRERTRGASESSCSIFSPKTPHTGDSTTTNSGLDTSYPFTNLPKTEFKLSRDFSSSHDEPSSGEWFTPSNSLFDETSMTSSEASSQKTTTKDEKLEQTKREILSQFDVFTELDPLELKNPPKKPLKELAVVVKCQNEALTSILSTSTTSASKSFDDNDDPFGEDPFVSLDPFADSEPQDLFEKGFMRNSGTSPKNVKFEESAPEPPPRPDTTVSTNTAFLIKPPPLPPKKQPDSSLKPPPRPPHTENEQIYAPVFENELKDVEKEEPRPALPVPMRKTKFETSPPERPPTKKCENFEDDYLTPIQFTKTQENLENFENNLDGLDITLSQLTLSGLNELAVKLNIPSAQLSNMTLVQLTDYLSNVIKSKRRAVVEEMKKEKDDVKEIVKSENVEFQPFKADFEANFTQNTSDTYDRYAVFRELIDKEIKQTKIEENIKTETVEMDDVNRKDEDKYAALREIVANDLLIENEVVVEKNNHNLENFNNVEFIEHRKENEEIILKSPNLVRNKIPSAIPSEIQRTTIDPLNSGGSLSDLVSNSSPELNEEVKTSNIDATAETWAVFDQVVAEKPKNSQSEEVLSPWSSDSKDGNGTPSDYRESEGDHRWVTSLRKNSSNKRDQRHHHHHQQQQEDDWWETSVKPDGNYNSNANRRRSTDSYEDEYYECYDRPRRRKPQPQQQGGSNWGGGHSSSSRDVSPWEEEPKRRGERTGWQRSRHRRPIDSWDEDEDYDYEDSRRFHWSGNRDPEGRNNDNNERWNEEWSDERRRRRRLRDNNDHWCCPDWDEEYDNLHTRYGSNRWSNSGNTPPGGSSVNNKWRDRKHDERYFSREESSWDDDYAAGQDSHYATTKRSNWKRPNSASEMERKSEKLRHLGGSDGERERRFKGNRRSRSRDSQYSEPPSHRHKETSSLTRNYKKNYNTKPNSGSGNSGAATFETEFVTTQLPEHSDKKSSFLTLQNRKKKELLKNDEINATHTFPRKISSSTKKSSPSTKYENNFKIPRSVTNNYQQTTAATTVRSKSLFEDDFSIEKFETTPSIVQEISVIKEEETAEENDSFDHQTNNRTINKRFSGNLRTDLKKSESVNIFVRENDPFDDDFFCENPEDDEIEKDKNGDSDDKKLRNGDKWTD